MGWIAAQRLTAPILALRAAARRIGRGEDVAALLDIRSGDEIEALAHDMATLHRNLATHAAERERAQVELRERNDRLEAIRSVTQEITCELSLTDLLELIIHRAAALVGASTATAYIWEGREGARQRCMTAGMDDFLPKPLRSDVLATVLKRWVGEAGQIEPTVIAVPARQRPDEPTGSTNGGTTSDSPLASLVASAIDSVAVERLRSLQADIVGELVDVFLEQAPQQIQAIRDTATRGDYDMLRRTVHTLKGDAAAWGAHDLVHQCAEIEELSPSDVAHNFDEHLAALQRELERVIVALRELGGVERQLV